MYVYNIYNLSNCGSKPPLSCIVEVFNQLNSICALFPYQFRHWMNTITVFILGLSSYGPKGEKEWAFGNLIQVHVHFVVVEVRLAEIII